MESRHLRASCRLWRNRWTNAPGWWVPQRRSPPDLTSTGTGSDLRTSPSSQTSPGTHTPRPRSRWPASQKRSSPLSDDSSPAARSGLGEEFIAGQHDGVATTVGVPAWPSLRVAGALHVWTGARELGGAAITCRGGRVTGDADAQPVSDVLDASGCFVTPGLVNAHHHLVQSAFRTMPGARHVPMRRWLAAMAVAYRRAAIDSELVSAAAAVGLAEALLFGVTTVADHHLVWPDDVDQVAIA